MKIVLTGATGFVGLNLLLRLLPREEIEEIAVCVRHGGKLHSLLAREGFCGVPAKVRVIEGTAADWGLQALSTPPDVCIHCAGVLFARSRAEYFRGNVEGTRNLIAALPSTTRVVVLSSQSAVGPTPPGCAPLDEEASANPLSFYGESKLAMEEMLAKEFAERGNLLVLRPPMVLGPRDSATLPIFQMAASPVWFKPGTKEKQLSWIGVGDLIGAILKVVEHERAFPHTGPTAHTGYFVAAGNQITDSDLIRTTAAVLQRKGVIVPIPKFLLKMVALMSKIIPAIGRAVPSLMPDRARELWEDRWLISGQRFATAFSWHASETLHDVLAEQAAYLKQNGLIE